jgi:GNAT superfamily N-acetyltransferase
VEIRLALTDDEILDCYPVMAELRPHLVAADFVPRVRRQMERAGYRLAFLRAFGAVQAVGGFRISECLAWGRFLYVDDLVTAAAGRSKGHGGALLEWLVEHAREHDCDQFHLDSGVQRFGAHRFYLLHRMDITSHHFALKLKG